VEGATVLRFLYLLPCYSQWRNRVTEELTLVKSILLAPTFTCVSLTDYLEYEKKSLSTIVIVDGNTVYGGRVGLLKGSVEHVIMML
jgi:hypothetical protein